VIRSSSAESSDVRTVVKLREVRHGKTLKTRISKHAAERAVNRPVDRAGLPPAAAQPRLELDQVEGRELIEPLLADVWKNVIPDERSAVAWPTRGGRPSALSSSSGSTASPARSPT
jgi:hypothetical protein